MTAPVDEATEQIAACAAALSCPARVTILRILLEFGSHKQKDLTPRLGLTQGTVAHHLRTLRETQLVTCHRAGPFAFYTATSAAKAALDGLAPRPPAQRRRSDT